MKKVLIAFVSFILLNISYAQNIEIKFYHENWEQVLEEAKKENKLIFLDAFAVWCGPCKFMANVVFKNDTVAQFYNANFVNAKFDMEKGEGLELAKKYQVRVYPTLLYLNSDGEVIHRVAGSMEPKDFIKEGELVLNGKHLKYYQTEFEKGNLDEKFFKEYIEVLQRAYLDASEVVKKYFSTLSDEKKKDKENLMIILENCDDITSELYQWLIDNRNYLGISEDVFYLKLKYKFNMDLLFTLRQNNNSPDAFNIWLSRIKNIKYDNKEKLIAAAKYYFYQRLKDWNNYLNAADEYVNKFNVNNPEELNELSWNTFRMLSKDKNALNKAEKWIKIALEQNEKSPELLDTYANILFAQGDTKKAIEIEERALNIAKEKNLDIKGYEETLQKFKSKK
ncbi:MAG TPA: thioredoxin domain-containing protein [Ignavibacteriales bacterium]|nr:thioredoxin domain-containing protein [Ignavibacteriales bacterium]HOL80596.1 thioredoxin domain-containing protein [Ignavibacteriales bacterium]HOM64284.1 thioredoxin domain-containing protein [Ignavibacteriales bacterium]HPP33070.1 thioredoxin domain-containing protein [Ignavibacteriales bacterium]HRR18288.1 thioredoxin domain-containing protein [Ignavibacteriales bacterium]